jgi:hypothetical protein
MKKTPTGSSFAAVADQRDAIYVDMNSARMPSGSCARATVIMNP